MKYLIALLVACLAAYAVCAQGCIYTISGRVVDEHDGQGLAYANIIRVDTVAEQGVVTSVDGSFAMTGICPGPLSLVVTHLGCEPDTLRFMLRGDTTMTLFLEHHTELLEMVRIEAERPHRDIAAGSHVEKMRILTNEGRSLAQLLDDAEGLQILSTGGNITKPMIHGMHSNRLVIMQGQTRIEGQQWGGEHAPEIDPLAADEIEVVTGASSLRHGPEAMAGAIIVKNESYLSDTAIHGWVHAAGASNGRKGTGSVNLQGRLTDRLPLYAMLQASAVRGGDLKAPDYYLDNTGTFERNMQGKLAWKKDRYMAEFTYSQYNTDIGILSYAHIGNLSDLQSVIDSSVPLTPSHTFSYAIEAPDQHVEHEVGAVHLWWKPALHNKLDWNLSRQYNLRQEFDRETFSQEGVPDLQYEITTWQTDLVYEHRWSARLKSELGLAGQQQANTYAGRFFIPNFRNFQGGVFTIHHLQWEHAELEGGLRYDHRWQQAFMFRNDTLYDPVRNFRGLSWNLGYSYAHSKWKALTNVGQAWRPPAINELYSGGLHHGAAAVEFGDEQLNEERMLSWTGQFQWQEVNVRKAALSGQATTYVHYFDGFIYLEPKQSATLTIRGAFPTFQYRGIPTLFRGVDLRLKLAPAKWMQYSTSFEWVRASNLNNGQDLVGIPPARFDFNATFNGRKEIKPLPAFGLDARWVLFQGNYPAGVDYTVPPAAYGLLGVYAEGDVTLWQTNMTYALRVNNLLNHRYRSYLNRLRYFADEPGRNITFSMRIPFNLSS